MRVRLEKGRRNRYNTVRSRRQSTGERACDSVNAWQEEIPERKNSMILDKLLGLAFEYKKTRLWHTLGDTSIFAVKLSDGKIGYISIMGAAGEHCAVGLYIGDRGFNSLRSLIDMDELEVSPFRYQENLLVQECLQCAFEGKDDLTEPEREEVREYARAHGIRISGKNAYPQFSRYRPYRIPWALQTEQDQEYLCDALAAAIALAKELEKNLQTMPDRIDEATETVPLIECQDGTYVFGRTPLPAPQKAVYPAPEASNDIAMAKLKKAKKYGVWQCEVIRFPKPIQSREEEIPYYPALLLAVEENTDFLLPVPPVVDYEENPEELLNLLTDAFLEQKVCPAHVKVPDERSRAFLQSFCDRLGIGLNAEEDLQILRNAEITFWNRFNMAEQEEGQDISAMLDMILNLEDEQLQSLTEEMIEQIRMLSMQESMPQEAIDKLNLILWRATGEIPGNLWFLNEEKEKPNRKGKKRKKE